jgi:hypothetical protein
MEKNPPPALSFSVEELESATVLPDSTPPDWLNVEPFTVKVPLSPIVPALSVKTAEPVRARRPPLETLNVPLFVVVVDSFCWLFDEAIVTVPVLVFVRFASM